MNEMYTFIEALLIFMFLSVAPAINFIAGFALVLFAATSAILFSVDRAFPVLQEPVRLSSNIEIIWKYDQIC